MPIRRAVTLMHHHLLLAMPSFYCCPSLSFMPIWWAMSPYLLTLPTFCLIQILTYLWLIHTDLLMINTSFNVIIISKGSNKACRVITSFHLPNSDLPSSRRSPIITTYQSQSFLRTLLPLLTRNHSYAVHKSWWKWSISLLRDLCLFYQSLSRARSLREIRGPETIYTDI